MTSRERIEAALRGERPDVVPIFLRDLTLGLDVCGYTTPEVCAGPDGGYDAEKSARCVMETQRLLGHDCVVGDHVIMANNASISGHVVVGEHANFGGYCGVPQFRRIGAHSHISGMSLVLKDVPAYMTVMGNPAAAISLNVEGMRRRGYSQELIKTLKDAHKVVYRQGRTIAEACTELEPLAAQHPEVALFVESIRDSRWGIVRPRSRGATNGQG